MAINFQQVAAPSFSGANELLKMAEEQRAAAMTGMTDTVTGAFGNIQNNNQAEMMNLLNMQTGDQMQDPVYQQQLSQQFKDIAASTGGVYDPMVMETMRDASIDKFRKREDAKYTNQEGKLGVENETLEVAQNKVKLTGALREEQAAIGEAAAAKKVIEQQRVADSYIFLSSKIALTTDPTQKAKYEKALDDLGNEIAETGDYSYMQGISQFVSQYGNEKEKLDYESWARGDNKTNAVVNRDLKIQAGVRSNNADVRAGNADKRADAGLAFNMMKYADSQGRVDQEALGAAVTDAGYSNAEVDLNTGIPRPEAIRGRIGGEVEAQRNLINNPLVTKDGRSITFTAMVSAKPPKNLEGTKLTQVYKKLNSFKGLDGAGKTVATLNDADKWEVLRAIDAGIIPTEKWSVGSVAGFSNYEAILDKNINNYVKWINETHKPGELDKFKRDKYNAEVQKIIKTFPNADHRIAAETLGMNDPTSPEYHLYPSYIHKLYGKPNNGKQFKINTQTKFVPIDESTAKPTNKKKPGLIGKATIATNVANALGKAAVGNAVDKFKGLFD